MKSLFCNQRGTIHVSLILIGLIISTLLTTLIYIMLNNIIIINSNNDNNKAGYLSESILDISIGEIVELSDEVVEQYLFDLYMYKLEYIENANIDKPPALYKPPSLNNYLQQKLIPNINVLSGVKNNPFPEYIEDHHYKLDIEYSIIKGEVEILATGGYKRARKFIRAKLILPAIINDGYDEYNLPKIKVSPMKTIQIYQTIGM